MASNFITRNDIQRIAFENRIDKAKISDHIIEMVEDATLRPALGKKLFDRLNASNDGLDAVEVELKEKLKYPIAYWVKYEMIPEIDMTANNAGIIAREMQHAERVSSKDRELFMQSTFEKARKMFSNVQRWMNENESSLTYYDADNIADRTSRKSHNLILPELP